MNIFIVHEGRSRFLIFTKLLRCYNIDNPNLQGAIIYFDVHTFNSKNNVSFLSVIMLKTMVVALECPVSKIVSI